MSDGGNPNGRAAEVAALRHRFSVAHKLSPFLREYRLYWGAIAADQWGTCAECHEPDKHVKRVGGRRLCRVCEDAIEDARIASVEAPGVLVAHLVYVSRDPFACLYCCRSDRCDVEVRVDEWLVVNACFRSERERSRVHRAVDQMFHRAQEQERYLARPSYRPRPVPFLGISNRPDGDTEPTPRRELPG